MLWLCTLLADGWGSRLCEAQLTRLSCAPAPPAPYPSALPSPPCRMVWFDRDAGKFFYFLFFFFLTLWYFTTLGIATVNLTPSVPLANVLCSMFFGKCFVVGGWVWGVGGTRRCLAGFWF